MSLTDSSEQIDRRLRQRELLRLDGLSVTFAGRGTSAAAVRGVDLVVPEGSTLGVVGESGSGKSVTMLAVMGLLAKNARRGGTIHWRGQAVTGPEQLASMRGRQLAMIFQDPMTSLNPLMTIGDQVAEVLRVHQGQTRKQAAARTKELLGVVGIASPGEAFDRYPHQYSGGMRQRVMIASALACEPELLIADEPTTALDVTVQAQILDLLAELQRDFGLSVVLITHDLAVVAQVCEQVAVMYAGKVVETGTVNEIMHGPRHPYTSGLLASSPRLRGERRRMIPIAGSPPDITQLPLGCAFGPRCQHLDPTRCGTEPPLIELAPGRSAACWRAEP
jgi:oligopeptide/dipeptide ABC transporter ATP-binding protein